MRMQRFVLTLLVVLAASVFPAYADAQSTDTLSPLRRAVARTKPLTRVRVELRDGQRLIGALGPIRADALEIVDPDGSRRRVTYEDITRYWRRGRATGDGALVAGLAGGAFGALVGAAFAAQCESDCPSSTASAMIGGAIVVGALGAGAGAIIGTAIPRWRQAWRSGRASPDRDWQPAPLVSVETRQDSPGPVVRPHSRRVGEVTAMLTGGYAAFDSGFSGFPPAEQGPGAGASLGLLFRLGPVGFGPELGLMAGTVGTLKTFAGVGRVDLRNRETADRVPYLVAGAGAYGWTDRETIFTGTLGVGVTLHGRWRIEARWNPALQYADPDNPRPTLLTIGMGRVLAW